MSDANAPEPLTARTALHKAAFWGHAHVLDYLINERKVDVNVKDVTGSTPLHDASQFSKCAQDACDEQPCVWSVILKRSGWPRRGDAREKGRKDRRRQ